MFESDEKNNGHKGDAKKYLMTDRFNDEAHVWIWHDEYSDAFVSFLVDKPTPGRAFVMRKEDVKALAEPRGFKVS